MRGAVHRGAIYLLCLRRHADGIGLDNDALDNLLLLRVEDFDEAVI